MNNIHIYQDHRLNLLYILIQIVGKKHKIHLVNSKQHM